MNELPPWLRAYFHCQHCNAQNTTLTITRNGTWCQDTITCAAIRGITWANTTPTAHCAVCRNEIPEGDTVIQVAGATYCETHGFTR